MRTDVSILFGALLASLALVSGQEYKFSSGRSQQQLLKHRGGTELIRRKGMVVDLLQTGKGEGKGKGGSKGSKSKKEDDATLVPSPTSTPGVADAVAPSTSTSTSSMDLSSNSTKSAKGKGKGKGGSSNTSKKEKRVKSSKKSKSKVKTKKSSKASLAPVLPPAFPPSGEMTRPPIPPVGPPTPTISGQPTPQPNSSPSDGPTPSTATRRLTAYGLEYTVTENRIPFRSEYLEVVELTRMYLSGFMNEQFADTQLTNLEEFLTIFTGSSFNFGQPIFVEYQSTAVFDESSTVVPTVEILDQTLETAFEGENLNGYIGMLQALPPGNVFSTSIFVNQTDGGQMLVMASSPQKRERVTTAAGAAAGAAGLALLAAGFVFYKRQQGKDVEITFNKPAGDNVTVAGETYAGTWSQASETQPFQSSLGQDREDSTIHEMRDEDDDSIDNSVDGRTPINHNDVTRVAMEWEGALHSISLS